MICWTQKTGTTMAVPPQRNRSSGERGRSTWWTRMGRWGHERSWQKESCCLWRGLPMFWDWVPNLLGWNTVQGCATCFGGSSASIIGLQPVVFSVSTWREHLMITLPTGTVLSFGYPLHYLCLCPSVKFCFRGFENVVWCGVVSSLICFQNFHILVLF